MSRSKEPLLPPGGGYRNLLSFKMARLTYDITVVFCDRYIPRNSRTVDQMIQAARSGVQNIAEGSQASVTSKKMELKLTNVARASLEELKLDYEDYLRQRDLPQIPWRADIIQRFMRRKCKTVEDVREWILEERSRCSREAVGCSKDTLNYNSDVLAANAALSTLHLACRLLDKQISHLAQEFEQNGGFTERLYRVRMQNRNGRFST